MGQCVMLHDRYSPARRFVTVTFDTGSCRDDYRMRLRIMARDLRQAAPDILLLQNVFATADNRYNTAGQLAQHLGMRCAFLPMRPKVRHLDGRPIDSWSGLAILSRHPILDTVRATLPCDGRDGERIVQFADLDIAGTRLMVANIQVSRTAGAEAVRRHQIERLAEWLAAAHDYDHLLVGGDFNAGPGEPALDPVRAVAGFDVYEAAPERGVDRLFSLTRKSEWRANRPAILDKPRTVLDHIDIETNQYPSERPAFAADLILPNMADSSVRRLPSWQPAVQIAAE